MAADVATQPTFHAATPRLLFQGTYGTGNISSQDYDVTADDQRFLMVQSLEQPSSSASVNVVLNWAEGLKRLVPTK